ncbi:MAG: DUF1189 family protein [Verrucomicrobiota bacterium]
MIKSLSEKNLTPHPIRPPDSYRGILSLVFFQPHLLPVLKASSCKKALLRVLLTGFLCGVLLALLQVVRLNEDVKAWGAWVAKEFDTVWYDDGRLYWQTDSELPYRTYYRGWRVYFAEEGSSFPSSPDKLGPGNKGIWISPDSVYTWWQLANDSTDIRHAVLYEDGKMFGMINVPAVIPADRRLSGNDLENAIIGIFRQSIPIFCFFRGLAVDFQLLFYVFVFSVIPYLLRSPLAAEGFESILTFYLYAAIPALFIATVYSAFNVPFLDFQTIFAAAFVGYLLFALWSISKAIRSKE